MNYTMKILRAVKNTALRNVFTMAISCWLLLFAAGTVSFAVSSALAPFTEKETTE